MHSNIAANCCIEGNENITRLENGDKNSPDILSTRNYLDKFVHISATNMSGQNCAWLDMLDYV